MFVIDFVLFFMICQVSNCERRIQNGQNLTAAKSYMVYLVKAALSTKNYDFWLCGGALVTSEFIITSAACVEDVNYLYAIAGYEKYVTDDKINTDACTKKKKKKVIFTCVPVSYNFDYDLLEQWAYIDIALVKVESPYDLNDASYEEYCSYKPTVIPINYDPKYQTADIDAIVLGWGHSEYWRKHGDVTNYNQEYLRYTPTLIMDKNKCKGQYEVYPNMTYIIDQYMICTLEEGNINDKGEPIVNSEPTAKGCDSYKQTLSGFKGISCDDGYGGGYQMDDTRREVKKSNKTYNNYTMYDYFRRAGSDTTKLSNKTRRNGICQNDHGGPLVTWVGTREVLIGVASVFKVSEENECVGPFLYTSTQCNGGFLDCVLNSQEISKNKITEEVPETPTRRDLCDSPPSVKGFDLVENHISWRDHPAGPAENEIQADLVRNRENENFAGQENYAANERYTANEKYSENVNYAANERFKANDGYKANERITDNKNYAANEKYSKGIARIGMVNNGGLMMRPQRPLHS